MITVERAAINRLIITVRARPAPQGSKRAGPAGQIREQSAYLPAWRAAVKRAVYEEYRRLGIEGRDLPLFRGPMGFSASFRLDHGARVDGPPDLDKLIRGTWDELTKTRVWEDDARVVELRDVAKVSSPGPEWTGARIEVWPLALPVMS